MSLLTASIVKNSHFFLARSYFIFFKHAEDQNSKAFTTKCRRQLKDRKSAYQLQQVLTLFGKLVAPFLG